MLTKPETFTLLAHRLGSYRQDIIDWQREMVRRIAVGPDAGGPGEGEKAAYLAALLTGWGLKVENYPAPDDRVSGGARPNLVVTLPGRRREKVWVLSHLDVVPPGEETLWHSDPYALRVEDDRLYGRGVEDDHHGIVISLLAVRVFLDEGLVPERTIALALVADEETGSHKGLGYLVRRHPQLFAPEDFIIVPDAGNTDGTMIEVAEKSILWLKLTVEGRQGHASRPHLSRNTMRAAAHMIVAFEALRQEFPLENPLFQPPESTFEPTKKEANVPNINTIPGRDVFYLDCRVLPEYELDRVIGRVKELGEEVARRFEVSLTVEPVQALQAAPATSPEAPVVQALSRAIQEVYNREARPRGIGGGTVAAFFRQQGLPAAVWMTVNDTAHQPNEYCDISTLMDDARVLVHVILNAG
ncbi:MAG: M20 family metallo-hydrolase [Deltaproteobacteria bacterium]|nr:M20 family metallo-hydrolase [Deltaproteobacteria bacterium]